MRIKNVNMLSGSITRGLLSMTIPIMVMNVMSSLFTIIDMTALKHFSDDNAVGAIGACGILITLFTSRMTGVSTGANIVVAKRIGAKDREGADNAVMTSIMVALAGGFFSLVGWCFLCRELP